MAEHGTTSGGRSTDGGEDEAPQSSNWLGGRDPPERGKLLVLDPRTSQRGQAGALLAPEQLNSALLRLLGKFHRGLILIDASSRVLASNPTASAMLSLGDALRVRNGRLFLLARSAQHTLEQFLAAGTSGSDAAETALTFKLERNTGAPPYRLLASRLDGDEPPSARIYALMVYEPHGQRFIPPLVLRTLYGLTASQAELAAQLFRGRSVQEAAAAMGVSTNTARSQLKKIFAKCDVRSQTELMQLLALGPRTL